MTSRGLEDGRMPPTSWGTLQTPLPPQSMEGASETSRPSETRITWPRDTISAKAVFGSLLTMGAFAAGVLFLMHSLLHGGERPIASVGVAEMQATGDTVATATSAWTPTSMPTPTWAPAATASGTWTPKPMAGTDPVPRAQAKSLSHVILYPFPVAPPAARIPTRDVPATEHSTQDTAGPNPCDDVLAAMAASTGPLP
jgi:hypothetical protein